MELIWLFLAGILVILLLYGDTRVRQSLYIPPEKAASIGYNKWPMWKEIEPAENRIRMVWLLHDYVPFVNAGSEVCAHTINTYLMSKPYKYDIWVASPGYPQRTYDNVRCFDMNDTQLLFKIIQSSHVLHSHSYAYRKQLLWISRITGKPFVEWVHTDNYVRSIGPQWTEPQIVGRQWTVFNADSLRTQRPDVPDAYTKVFIPAVDYHAYRVDDDKKTKKYVTLSNVNENKGGNLLIQLAKAIPEMEFQGILGGYRKQITYDGLPNLRYIQHTTEIKEVYAQTMIQIMPSKEETWGRTAVEAMSSGIPVVVSPTPGLRECCMDAAIYCDRSDLDSWVVTLRKLKDDKEFYNQRSRVALDRAHALDPSPVLARMEEWLETDVVKSAVDGRMPTTFEKNILFR